jgi:hypothetical protein
MQVRNHRREEIFLSGISESVELGGVQKKLILQELARLTR